MKSNLELHKFSDEFESYLGEVFDKQWTGIGKYTVDDFDDWVGVHASFIKKQ